MNFMIYLTSINIIGFLLTLIDKRKAIKNKWRISEGTLLLISLIGGCFGTALAMFSFHHKTRKIKFKLVYLLCLIWIYLIYSLFTNIA